MFKRKPAKRYNFTSDPYTPELKRVIYDAIEDLNDVLALKGKPKLPVEKYEMYEANEAASARERRHHE